MSWVGAHQDGNHTGAFGSVDPLGQQQQELTDAQRKSVMSQFEEWAQRLNIVGGKHKIWLSEVEAFDKESDLHRFCNNRALTKKGVVEDLCDTYYTIQGVADQRKATTFLASRLVTVSDIQPTRLTGSVPRLFWEDMSQLGLAHSRHVDEICSNSNESREHHSDVTAAVMVMPNTPKCGKGLKSRCNPRAQHQRGCG